MRQYRYLIFDVDDTLLDFHVAYTKAQRAVAENLRINYSEEYQVLSEECGWRAWKESGLDHTECLDIQKTYHVRYEQYLKRHYGYLTEMLGIIAEADEMAMWHLNSIASTKIPMETDTLQIYRKLAENYKLAIATNGIEWVQKLRMSEFLPYTERVYISESIGAIKPSTLFYDHVLNDLQCDPQECLMIGDSITNDMIGAKSAGMDVCFYNTRQKVVPVEVVVDYEIRKIRELIDILPN